MIRMMTMALVMVLCGAAAMVEAQTDRPAPKPAAKNMADASAPLNLNTATQAQLETLPGIGASTATRILEYRQKNGGFKKVEDLMNVQGIGEKNFLKLKTLLTVTPPKTDRAGGSQ